MKTSVVSGQWSVASRVPRVCTQTRASHSAFRISHSAFTHRGAALIITVWTLAALAGLVLALGHAVGVEALAAADRADLAKAKAAELGAEQFALSAVDWEILNPGATTSDLNIQNLMGSVTDPTVAMQLGDCRVWILKPDPDDETAVAFGLTDEASKLDINNATSDQLLMLPNIVQENVDCIIDWRDPDDTPGAQGAEDSYYAALATPYHCKNLPFETVEELNLVKSINTDDSGAITDLLYGLDVTHCGRVPDGQGNSSAAPDAMAAPDILSNSLGQGANPSNRGIAPFITVYGVKASTKPPTSATSASTAPKIANVNSQDNTQLRANLTQYLGGENVSQILQLTQARTTGPNGTVGRFANIWDWAVAVNLTSDQFSKIIHYVRASSGNANATTATPQINVNTAPKQVLMCLPSLTDSDAQAIVDHVTNNTPDDPSDISWLLDVVPKAKLAAIGTFVTGVSYCYSADILAATLDGRAFTRVRIVIDASSGTSKIIYRRDLTSLGWPLPPEYRPDPNNRPQPLNQPVP